MIHPTPADTIIRNYDPDRDERQLQTILQGTEHYNLDLDGPEVLRWASLEYPDSILVAESIGQLVGHIHVSISPGTHPLLSRLIVREGNRKRGVGGALVVAGIAVLMAHGKTYGEVIIDRGREDLRLWYERRGFCVAGKYTGMEMPLVRDLRPNTTEATPNQRPAFVPLKPPVLFGDDGWLRRQAALGRGLRSGPRSYREAFAIIGREVDQQRFGQRFGFPQSVAGTHACLQAASIEGLTELRSIKLVDPNNDGAALLRPFGPEDWRCGWRLGLLTTAKNSPFSLMRLFRPPHGPRVPTIDEINGYYIAAPKDGSHDSPPFVPFKVDNNKVEEAGEVGQDLLAYMVLAARGLQNGRLLSPLPPGPKPMLRVSALV